jgi:hypothetical protein
MKLNKKVIDLISEGFKANTLKNMTESQIDILHKRISESKKEEQKEQAGVQQKTQTLKTTTIPAMVAKNQGVTVANKGKVNVKADNAGNVSVSEIGESDKKSKNNPWAICRAQQNKVGKDKMTDDEVESCIKDIKKKNKEKTMKENLFIEKKILNLVEKHIQPKMTKKDFLTVLENEDTKTKEPKVKPGTKSPTREKPHDPFKPAPHKQPKPKAGKGKGLPEMLKFKSLGIKFKK